MDTRAAPMRKLAAHIVNCLGEHKTCLKTNLLGRIRKVYSNIPRNYVDQRVELELLALERKGIVHFRSDGNVLLTEKGQAEYATIITPRIWKEPKRTSLEEDTHDKMKGILCKLASLLGAEAEEEHTLVKEARLDVIWRANPKTTSMSHAFEVHYEGNLKNAVSNLDVAGAYYKHCKLFLLVRDEEDMTPIQRLLGGRFNASIKVLKTSQVRGWLSDLESMPRSDRQALLRVFCTPGLFSPLAKWFKLAWLLICPRRHGELSCLFTLPHPATPQGKQTVLFLLRDLEDFTEVIRL